MNYKTTFLLIVFFVLAAAVLYIVRSAPQSAETSASPVSVSPTANVSRDLIQKDTIGEPVKIICKQSGKDDWVFEKLAPEEGGDAVWHMTAPDNFKVVAWEVDRFNRQLTGLKYDISYKPGEAGAVTAAEAGLEPPQAEVTLSDADDETVTVEIGQPASDQKTFVRLDGSKNVCVGNANLRTLFKKSAVEYRDRQVLRFNADDATRLEIVARPSGGSPTTFTFTNDGARWMIESPVTARATDKVADAVKALSSLNAVAWVADATDRLAVYGLETAPLTVSVTVESEIEVEKPAEEAGNAEDDESAEEPVETETVVNTYVVHLSDLAPIGEDTKRYLRIDDEPYVATVMKTTTDKLRPDLAEWREMQVTSANVTGATRISLTTTGQVTTLIEQDGAWQFEQSAAPAESEAVTELVNAIQDLEAVAYVEPGPDELAAMGFDDPQADIRLTVPGVEGVERITVGGFTDPTTKRLIYVRRNEAASIAKVRAPDVEKLLRNPLKYMTHQILAVPSGEITHLTITTDEPCTSETITADLQRDGDAWTMVAPIEDNVRVDRVNALLSSLANLRAQSIVADSDELTAYGLHDPDVTLLITHQPEVTSKLLVTRHDGQYYAKLADRSLIYAVEAAFYDTLRSDFRDASLLTFSPGDLQRFAIRDGNSSHTFERKDGRWVFVAEPDLPLDQAKLDALVESLRGIEAERFVRYGEVDRSRFGLAEPAYEARFTAADGTEEVLVISASHCDESESLGVYAATSMRTGIAIIPETVAEAIIVSIDNLEQ